MILSFVFNRIFPMIPTVLNDLTPLWVEFCGADKINLYEVPLRSHCTSWCILYKEELVCGDADCSMY